MNIMNEYTSSYFLLSGSATAYNRKLASPSLS